MLQCRRKRKQAEVTGNQRNSCSSSNSVLFYCIFKFSHTLLNICVNCCAVSTLFWFWVLSTKLASTNLSQFWRADRSNDARTHPIFTTVPLSKKTSRHGKNPQCRQWLSQQPQHKIGWRPRWADRKFTSATVYWLTTTLSWPENRNNWSSIELIIIVIFK